MTGVARVSRLPSGPGGPQHLQAGYQTERVQSARAVHDACSAILADGDMPSIKGVERHGIHPSTINRQRYKQIVHAAKARQGAFPNGMPEEEPNDLFRQMGERIAEGEWGPHGFWDEPQRMGGHARDDEAGRLALLARLAKSEAETAHLREQVTKAVAVAAKRGDTIKRQRKRIAELEEEVAELQMEPLEERKPQRWAEDGE